MHDPVKGGDRAAGVEAPSALEHMECAGKIFQTAASRAPFIKIAHEDDRRLLLQFQRSLDDRGGLPPPPESGQVQMHAKDRELLPGQFDMCHDRTAWFETGDMHDVMSQNLCGFADQYRIAMPAHGIRLNVERDGAIVAVHFQQSLWNGSGSSTEPAIGFLQRDNVCINLVQDIDDPPGIAAPIGADRFADIVARNL